MRVSEFLNDMMADGYLFNLRSYPAGSHTRDIMKMGRTLPCCKSQVQYYVSNVFEIDVLNREDVEKLEMLLNKHGLYGEYKWTKSGRWVRIQNINDVHKALKLEYIK